MIFWNCNTISIHRLWRLFILLVAAITLLQQEQYVDCFATSSYSSSFDLNVQSYYKRFQKFSTKPYDAPHITKILLLSDLHMDYAANQQWLHNLCTSSNNTNHEKEEEDDYTQTLIIVAGDVSHDIEILQWTFQTLQRFAEVVYTPGNHELWLDKKRNTTTTNTNKICQSSGKGDGCTNSIEKLERVLQCCLDNNIHIGPVKVSPSNNDTPLWVIPLLSWHHESFDTEPQIECWDGIPSARRVVSDYYRTTWPQPLSQQDDSVAEFLDGLNDVILDLEELKNDNNNNGSILTVSHFLPRIELIPEKRYLTLPTLHSSVGSTYLESRLRQLRSSCGKSDDKDKDDHLHAFGHSHLSWDLIIDGVRYVHVPLAYPREWQQRRGSLEIGTMQGEESDLRHPVCIWDGSLIEDECITGFPKDWLGGWWSKYYDVIPREPHRNKELAPWAAKRFR